MNVSFNGYRSPIKTMWRQGILKVSRGLYGEVLTSDNISVEHLIPRSVGGETVLGNLALASQKMNSLRGSKPLREVLSAEQALAYISQFAKDKRKIIVQYVAQVTETFKNLGVI